MAGTRDYVEASLSHLRRAANEYEGQIDDLIGRLTTAAEDMLRMQKDAHEARKSAEQFCQERNALQGKVTALLDLVKRLQRELHEEAMRPFRRVAATICASYTQMTVRLDQLWGGQRHQFRGMDPDHFFERYVFVKADREYIRFALTEEVLSDRAIETFSQEVAETMRERIAKSIKDQLTEQRGPINR